jgi:oligoribonuclease NrnB/cAMP/cGMP phosphodiesterase (DHH superfamily)
MNPLIICHGPCLDGAGAALAAWVKFGEDAEYRFAQYGDVPPTDDEIRGREVYILDFSYPRAELERMHAVAAKLQVLDHHKTAQADLEGLPYCEFTMSLSGAVMAWRYFHGTETPWLLAYIQDRDLWRWEFYRSKEVSAALAASGAGADFRKLIPLFENWDLHLQTLTDTGTALLSYEQELVARIAKRAEEITLDGAKMLAVCSPVLQSEVGEALAIESYRRGFSSAGAVYYREPEKKVWRVSLRSRAVHISGAVRPDVLDVSVMARKYGGGGHVQAAGFECAMLPWVTSW